MTTENRLYEGMFVMPQTLVREDKEAGFEIIKSVLGKYNAQIEYIDVWQERALAYEINHVRNATYILTYFKAEPTVISKIERTIRITEEILRALIVRPNKGFDLSELNKAADEAKNEDSEEPKTKATKEKVSEVEGVKAKDSKVEETKVEEVKVWNLNLIKKDVELNQN